MQADTDAVLSISKIEIFFRKDNRGGGEKERKRVHGIEKQTGERWGC